MNETVRDLRSTVLESMSTTDRREAMERLAELFEDVDAESRRTVLETYRRVLEEATASSERALAREKLEVLFDRAPGEAAPVAVRAHCWLATEARHSGERVDAIDALGRFARTGLSEELEAYVEETLVEVAAGSRQREREYARERLADLLAAGDVKPSADLQEETGVDDLDVAVADAADLDGGGASMSAYLAVSLAEHLEAAAGESPAACLDRARELETFVEETPPRGTDGEDVRGALSDLVDQLEVHPGEEIGDQRREAVASLAGRVKRLYLRGDGP